MINCNGILISIKPKWCELIASGKKTIEVRKTKPKTQLPFKCYIYCTSVKNMSLTEYVNIHRKTGGRIDEWSGKIIGEFICDFINEYTAEFTDGDCYEDIRQVWENEDYTYEKDKEFAIVTSNEDEDPDNCFLCNASCLSFEDIKKYIGANFHEIPFYGWHISDLVIYDEPKDIDKFEKPCSHDCKNCKYWYSGSPIDYEPPYCEWEDYVITRPPQSWCYVEEVER